MSIDAQIVPSSGNVFADLGFEPAEAQLMAMRAELMIELEKVIKSQVLTQTAAAATLGVSGAGVSDLVRFKSNRSRPL